MATIYNILRYEELRNFLVCLSHAHKIFEMSEPMGPAWIARHYQNIHGGVCEQSIMIAT